MFKLIDCYLLWSSHSSWHSCLFSNSFCTTPDCGIWDPKVSSWCLKTSSDVSRLLSSVSHDQGVTNQVLSLWTVGAKNRDAQKRFSTQRFLNFLICPYVVIPEIASLIHEHGKYLWFFCHTANKQIFRALRNFPWIIFLKIRNSTKTFFF